MPQKKRGILISPVTSTVNGFFTCLVLQWHIPIAATLTYRSPPLLPIFTTHTKLKLEFKRATRLASRSHPFTLALPNSRTPFLFLVSLITIIFKHLNVISIEIFCCLDPCSSLYPPPFFFLSFPQRPFHLLTLSVARVYQWHTYLAWAELLKKKKKLLSFHSKLCLNKLQPQTTEFVIK